MAKNEGTKSGSPGDVDNIRKILFGDQVSQIEERFSQNETAIAQLRAENRNLRQALEAELTQREVREDDLRQELHQTQKILEEFIQNTANKIEEKVQVNQNNTESAHHLIEEKIRTTHEMIQSVQEEHAATLTAQQRLLNTIAQVYAQYLDEARSGPGNEK